ncbi:hypothetical protein FLL45_14080 [Aliikangiella marina]|uniref:DUF6265 domain-containing protein n=1 Tax=Aliikangiella marina TaxID=1712262 RepID=A0A545T9U6_9GAMM|nr:DUF6265 family protein [Aliikangiella marina]TQV73985.1 hypothetical protein FLL45_14080 [Aliikangiella marina]
MTGKKQSLLIIFLAFISPWSWAKECSTIDQVDWLLGQWETVSNGNLIRESWQIVDARNRAGTSTTQKLGTTRTSFIETLRIVEMSGSIFYLAKTPQNQLPVAFKLIHCDNDRLKFENLVHDFPNIIEYQRESNVKVNVNVSGKNSQGFQLSYQRAKPVANLDVVNEFILAYNRKSLAEMLAFAHDKIRWMSIKNNNVTVEAASKKALREAMKGYFEGKSQTTSKLESVTQNGAFINGIERASWISQGQLKHQCAAVVYELEGLLIKNVWYFPAQKCGVIND